MVAFSFFGAGVGLLILLTAAVVTLGRRRRYADILFLCGSLLVAQVVNRIVKELIAKRRPPVPDHELVHAPSDMRLVVLALLAVALLAALATRARRTALAAAGVLVAAWLLYEVLAPSVLVSHKFSFPSGHATSSMAFAAALVVVAWPSRRLRWPVVAAGALFVTGVGVSRVAFAVHYPSDVLGGWTLAIAAVCAVRLVLLLAVSRTGHASRASTARVPSPQ